MKKILITGANSYVGTNVEKWLMKEPDKYCVETLDMKDLNWKDFDFSRFDVVFHVAAIVHHKKDKISHAKYMKINHDLALDVAKKSKSSGVRQFIFMSSMSVYGVNKGMINIDTKEHPNTIYGITKFKAEKSIKNIENKDFTVSILRPPMIYGKDCKGNYKLLRNFAIRVPFFPKINNKRSMLHIDNFCVFLSYIITYRMQGTFFPQNNEYTNVSEMVKLIGHFNGNSIKLSKIFNPIVLILKLFSRNISKVFDDLVYDYSMSNGEFQNDYVPFKESIMRSEMNYEKNSNFIE